MVDLLYLIYLIGSVGAMIFVIALVPDTIKAVKAKEIKGVTVASSALAITGMVCALITEIYFKNWPFVISNVVSMLLSSIILVNRIRKIKS